jgi:hypothetical protein
MAACARRDPPQWDSPTAAAPATTPLRATVGTQPTSPGTVPTQVATDAAVNLATATDAASGVPSLLAVDGDQPQTTDRPKADSALFRARMQLLFEAIAQDDPERALPAFFPKDAYKQVKAIPNPEGDWRRRLVAAFQRDIHKLHERVGAGATLQRIDVPESRGRWVEPDEETNKLGYYRVYGTRMFYRRTDDERERTIDVKSLISWRGEWYVVHLSGFK